MTDQIEETQTEQAEEQEVQTSTVVNADGSVNLDVALEELEGQPQFEILKKALEEKVPAYNEVINLVNQYRAATNIDGSVSDFIETTEDDEIVKMREKVAQVKATLEKLNEKIKTVALEKMKSELSSDFDEAQAKRDYQDKTVAVREDYNTFREMFKMFGRVKFINAAENIVDGKTQRRNSRWEAVTPAGEAILALSSFPRLTSGGSAVPSSEGKYARKWAMKEGWKTEDGKEVVSRGPLPTGLLEAWKEAGSPVIED